MSELQKLPTSWRWAKIADVGEIVTGNTPKTSVKENYSDDGVLFVKPPNLTGRGVRITSEYLTDLGSKDARILPTGSVMVSCIGNLGKVGFAIQPTATNQQINSIIFSKDISSKYGFYYCLTLENWLNSQSSATTIAIVNKSKFSLAPFPVAPREEQLRIADKLDELFSELDIAVKELKAAQIKLTQYRQSLLKSAMDGALTQQWRAENNNQIQETGEQLLARILIERKQRWEQQKLAEFKAKDKTPPKNWQDKYPEPVKPDTTDLPELPQGWVWASLSQLVDLIQIGPFGSLLHKSDYISGGIPLINPTHIKKLKIEPDYNLTITKDKLSDLQKYVMSEGDIVIGRRGEMGRCALVSDKENGWLCGTGSLFIRVLKSLNPEFYTWVLSSKRTKDFLAEFSVGTTMQNLNQKILHTIPVPLLPENEQAAVSDIIHSEYDRIDKQIQDINTALKQSEAQRKNILKSAFSGQLIPQNPNDEPASALLEKIQKEREELAKIAKPRSKRQLKKS